MAIYDAMQWVSISFVVRVVTIKLVCFMTWAPKAEDYTTEVLIDLALVVLNPGQGSEPFFSSKQIIRINPKPLRSGMKSPGL